MLVNIVEKSSAKWRLRYLIAKNIK